MGEEKDMNFGQQIKELRKKEGLTQEQFAQKLMVTRQAVSNWEKIRIYQTWNSSFSCHLSFHSL